MIRGAEMAAVMRLAVALVMGSTFLLSGAAKLRSGRFVADLANYRILPISTVIPIAVGLPFVEVGLAGLLLFWPVSPLPVYVASAVLAGFAAAMTVNR